MHYYRPIMWGTFIFGMSREVRPTVVASSEAVETPQCISSGATPISVPDTTSLAGSSSRNKRLYLQWIRPFAIANAIAIIIIYF